MTLIDDISFLAFQLRPKAKSLFFRQPESDVKPESQREEELTTRDNQEVENVNELTFLDSKVSLFKN